MSDGWTIGSIILWTENWFRDKYQLENARLDAELLLAYTLNYERIKLYVNFHQPLLAEELTKYKSLIKRRAEGEPIAYILEQKEFMKKQFFVDRRVLIPRPDSEALVEAVLECDQWLATQKINFAEIGVGSGALTISILCSRQNWLAWVGDLSVDAIAVAKKNAVNYEVSERIEFIHSDVFDGFAEKKNFDFIISNPPYLRSSELALLQKDLSFEPQMALDGGIDGFQYISKIVTNASARLTASGRLFLEVGCGQTEYIKQKYSCVGNMRLVDVKKDLGNIERVIVWQKS